MTARSMVLTAAGVMVLCLCGTAWAEEDLTKAFEADKDTLRLFHMEDVATGQLADAVEQNKAATVVDAVEAEGKFGKAMSCDGTKGWADVPDLPRVQDVKALTMECWVKFKERARGDVICRNTAYMMRLSGTVRAYLRIDGAWRIVEGTKTVPVGKWTHLAITYDKESKEVKIYVDGALDVSKVPDGVTDGKLDLMGPVLRLGNHTWEEHPAVLNGELDEVRISSVAREYKPLDAEE